MRRAAIIFALCSVVPALARGGTWSEQVSNTNQGLFVVDAVNAQIAWAGGNAGAVIRTVDGGTNWELRTAPSGNVRAINARDATNCIVGDATGRLYRTTNGGVNWNLVATASGSFINGIHFFDANRGWALGDPVGGTWVILESTDGGATWAQSPAAPQSGTALGLRGSYSWLGSTIGVFGTGGGQGVLWRTSNGGASWNSVTTDLQQVACVALDVSGVALAGGDLNVLDRSTDSGVTWSLTQSPTPDRILALSREGDSVWALTGQSGHFHSPNGGANWTTFPFPGYTALDLDFDAGGSGWSVGQGGRLWRYDAGVTGISEPLAVSEPGRVRVGPNPFALTATFVFEAGRSSPIAICDVTGREVARLNASASNASIVWNGRDARGQEVPGGVYFYRVLDESQGFVTGRLVRAH